MNDVKLNKKKQAADPSYGQFPIPAWEGLDSHVEVVASIHSVVFCKLSSFDGLP